MLKNLLTGFLLTLYTDVLVGITPAVQGVVPPLFTDPAPFEAALASELKQAKQWSCVTGVIVPHHLLAIDVLAKVFASIAIRGYTTVFVLSPDHFSASRTPAATTRQSFQTPFGRLDTDQKIAADLIDGSLVSDDPRLFKREHGIHAVLPFVARLFPKAHVVPIALSIHMTTPDVNELVERLRPHLSDETLVLLSSDFSHYLPLERAIERDQETLSLLAAGDTDGLRDLIQPDHLDSRAGLLIQHGLQTGLGSRLLVIANKNSQEYSKTRLLQTTSYVGAIYASDLDGPCNTGQEPADLCFGGDFFTGRGLRPLLADTRSRDALVDAIEKALGNCPLVVNFEGVLVPQPVVGAPPLRLWAEIEPAVNLLKQLDVLAVSLANNHSGDFGEARYRWMRKQFRNNGIAVIEHGRLIDIGGVRIFGMTEVEKRDGQPVDAIFESDFDVLRRDPIAPPVIAFLHWGRQFETFPRPKQLALAAKLRRLGISAFIGTHPHQASDRLTALQGGGALMAYSLGNLVFDQTADTANGAIVKLRIFEQGTFFARQVNINDPFEEAKAVFDASNAIRSQHPPAALPPLRHRQLPFRLPARISWIRKDVTSQPAWFSRLLSPLC